MRWPSISGISLLALGLSHCSLFNSTDDLTENQGPQCRQNVSCSGCVGCDARCACLAPADLTQCVATCRADGQSSGGNGGTGGSGGVTTDAAGDGTGTGGNGGDETGGTAGLASGGLGGTGSGGTNGQCADPGTTDPCSLCIQMNCLSECQTCEDDAACLALVECVQSCADAACQTACAQQNPNGVSTYNAFVTCGQMKCGNQCQSG